MEERRKVYHGTNFSFDDFEDQHSSKIGVYGAGHYFTEDPALANSHAVKTSYSKVFDTMEEYQQYKLDNPLHLEVKFKQLSTRIRVEFVHEGLRPQVRPAYINAQKPLRIDKDVESSFVSAVGKLKFPNGQSALDVYERGTYAKTETEHVFRAAEEYFILQAGGDDQTGQAMLLSFLEHLGYDSLVHTGSPADPTSPVWVAFRADIIEPAYSPKNDLETLQELSKETPSNEVDFESPEL